MTDTRTSKEVMLNGYPKQQRCTGCSHANRFHHDVSGRCTVSACRCHFFSVVASRLAAEGTAQEATFAAQTRESAVHDTSGCGVGEPDSTSLTPSSGHRDNSDICAAKVAAPQPAPAEQKLPTSEYVSVYETLGAKIDALEEQNALLVSRALTAEARVNLAQALLEDLIGQSGSYEQRRDWNERKHEWLRMVTK
jgi:hypothetical protein